MKILEIIKWWNLYSSLGFLILAMKYLDITFFLTGLFFFSMWCWGLDLKQIKENK